MDQLIDSEIAAFAKDGRGRYLWINRAGAAMLWRKPFEIIGRTDFELFEKSSAELMGRREAELIFRGASREYDSVARANGLWRLYRSAKHVYRGPNNVRDHILGFAINATHGLDCKQYEIFRCVNHSLKARPEAYAAFMGRLCLSKQNDLSSEDLDRCSTSISSR